MYTVKSSVRDHNYASVFPRNNLSSHVYTANWKVLIRCKFQNVKKIPEAGTLFLLMAHNVYHNHHLHGSPS